MLRKLFWQKSLTTAAEREPAFGLAANIVAANSRLTITTVLVTDWLWTTRQYMHQLKHCKSDSRIWVFVYGVIWNLNSPLKLWLFWKPGQSRRPIAVLAKVFGSAGHFYNVPQGCGPPTTAFTPEGATRRRKHRARRRNVQGEPKKTGPQTHDYNSIKS